MRVPVGGARGATAGLLDQSACSTWTMVQVCMATALRSLPVLCFITFFNVPLSTVA